ncbi:MAG: adenylate/guanylate cyclase domain-containing response regulator, partial [Chloroflexi bacterium UTCFX4]
MSQILIVDDNRMNRLLLSRGVEQLGHKVTFAENGRQALEMIQRDAYDLILLDVEMPELDGYQVLEKLRGDIHLREIPVIITSSLDEIDSVVKCIELGAEDYLHKPINPVLLKARLNASLEKKNLRDQQRELMRQRTELLSKFATEQVAEDLLTGGFALGGKYVEATAMFCDIRSFTTIAEAQSPAETIELLNNYYTLMMDAIGNEGGIVNQMVGDGLMAIFGAPIERADHRQAAVRAAKQMVELIELFNQEQVVAKRQPIRIGIGIASGQVIAGYTGTMRRATYTCVGDTVNLAARLESQTKVLGEIILLDERTRAGLDGTIAVIEKGEIEIKGKA